MNVDSENILVNDTFSNNVFTCPICGKTFRGFGNNPKPVAEGRCCNDCNSVVIQMRMMMHNMAAYIKRGVKELSFSNPLSIFYSETLAVGIYRRKRGIDGLVESEDFPYKKELRSTILNYIKDNCKNKIRKIAYIPITSKAEVEFTLQYHLYKQAS